MNDLLTHAEIAALVELANCPPQSSAAGIVIERHGTEVFDRLTRAHGLVDRPLSERALWFVSERGQVFVNHLLQLPLPERVTAWRMNGAATLQRVEPAASEEGAAPPRNSPATPVPVMAESDIPSDPDELANLAARFMDQGLSTGEVKLKLRLTAEQSLAILGV